MHFADTDTIMEAAVVPDDVHNMPDQQTYKAMLAALLDKPNAPRTRAGGGREEGQHDTREPSWTLDQIEAWHTWSGWVGSLPGEEVEPGHPWNRDDRANTSWSSDTWENWSQVEEQNAVSWPHPAPRIAQPPARR